MNCRRCNGTGEVWNGKEFVPCLLCGGNAEDPDSDKEYTKSKRRDKARHKKEIDRRVER